MLLSEALQTLKKAGYKVEPLNEGKLGRTLGALALSLTSFVQAHVPQNIYDIKNDDNYVSLTQEELPKELQGGYVKYNADNGEYIKCKTLKSIGQKVCTVYDDNYKEKTYAMYDRKGDLISVKNINTGSEFTQESSLLKPGYKVKNYEEGKTGFLLTDNGLTELFVKDGKIIKSVKIDERNEKTFTKWEDNVPVEDITYYNNDGKTIRTEFVLETGEWTEYYSNGTVKVEGKYSPETGKKEGKWIVYFEDGRKAQTSEYENGKLQGKVQCSDGRKGREGFDCRFDKGNSRFNSYYNSSQDWQNPVDEFE